MSQIAITVDAEHPDRPSFDPVGNAVATLDVLRDRAVLGTFFVQGKWALANPDLVRRMREEGHLVGSHSDAHCVYPNLSPEGMARDLSDARNTPYLLSERRDRGFVYPRVAVMMIGSCSTLSEPLATSTSAGRSTTEIGSRVVPQNVSFPVLSLGRSGRETHRD